MKIYPALGFILLVLFSGDPNGEAATSDRFFVSMDGSDLNPGTKDQPFATLHRAQLAVRDIQASGLSRPVTVAVRAGIYCLENPFRLTPEDSGTESCPVTWKAADGEKVILRGGKLIDGFQKYSDQIYVTDLKNQGVEDPFIYQLFHLDSGEDQPAIRQQMARYPDYGPEHPRTGGYMLVDQGFTELENSVEESTAKASFTYRDSAEHLCDDRRMSGIRPFG
jgi:hypothetical protein